MDPNFDPEDFPPPSSDRPSRRELREAAAAAAQQNTGQRSVSDPTPVRNDDLPDDGPPRGWRAFGKEHSKRQYFIGQVVHAPLHRPHHRQYDHQENSRDPNIGLSAIGTYAHSKMRPVIVIAVQQQIMLLPITTKSGRGLSTTPAFARSEFVGIKNATDSAEERNATDSSHQNLIFYPTQTQLPGEQSYVMRPGAHVRIICPTSMSDNVPLDILGYIQNDAVAGLLSLFCSSMFVFPLRRRDLNAQGEIRPELLESTGNMVPAPNFALYEPKDLQMVGDTWARKIKQMHTDLTEGKLLPMGRYDMLLHFQPAFGTPANPLYQIDYGGVRRPRTPFVPTAEQLRNQQNLLNPQDDNNNAALPPLAMFGINMLPGKSRDMARFWLEQGLESIRQQ